VLSYTTLQAQYPSWWLSNTDALGSVEQEYRLVSWFTFTTEVTHAQISQNPGLDSVVHSMHYVADSLWNLISIASKT